MQEMITLGFLFNNQDLFVQGPQGKEGINLHIVVSPDLKSPAVWSGILNLCARLCFETLSFDPPLIVPQDQTLEENPCLIVNLNEQPADDSPVTDLDSKNPGEVWFEKKGRYQVSIQSDSGQALGRVLTCLATGSLQSPARPMGALPLVITPQKLAEICPTPPQKPLESTRSPLLTRFDPFDFTGLYTKNASTPFLQKLDRVWVICSSSLSYESGLALLDAVSAMVMEATAIVLPLVVAAQDLAGSGTVPGSPYFLVTQTDPAGPGESSSLTVSFPDLSGPVHLKADSKGFSTHLYDWVDLALKQGGQGFSKVQALRNQVTLFPSQPPQAPVAPPEQQSALAYEFAIDSETDEILETLSGVSPGQGALGCDVWTSKPAEIRARLGKQIEALLLAKGYRPRVRVFNAFKPGLCRILDYDLPKLKRLNPARIAIHYRPFDSLPRALEPLHRWRHELFPAGEILANALGLSKDAVTLCMDETQEEIYGVTALDEQGHPLFQDLFSPFFHTFDYMPDSPEKGSVSPVCAGITLALEGNLLLRQAFPTDRDRFWKKFQTDVIPDLVNIMEAQILSGTPHLSQAFFESIQVEVCLEESCYRLGFRDEQISPMETLHEDIYFFLLAVFEEFSRQHPLPPALKLGQILPRVSPVTDEKGAWAKIIATPARNPVGLANGSPLAGGNLPAMEFDTLVMNRDRWRLSCSHKAHGHDLVLTRPGFGPELAGSETCPGPVPDNQLLTAKSVEAYLARLDLLPHVRVWEIARSLQGRPIYAVEAFKVRGSRVSIPRLRLARPTLLVNARHHANEISSTNAVLRFVQFLGSPQGEPLIERANAVFIPLENSDGVATFEKLHLPGSRDILHAARYNALGAEFYDQYFAHPPAFSEALAKQRLWHRWLPELVADLHGVPGHEWCQPYAGYLPKGFRQFWIPRAFVYVHLPFLEDKAHPLHGQAMALAATLRRAMAQDREIVAANQFITGLYQTYARLPEPDLFPEADSTELTALPLLGRARNFNFAVQYPAITRAEVIVEVPDEVAHGETLRLCVAAHYQIQQALIQALTPVQTEKAPLTDPISASISARGTFPGEFVCPGAMVSGDIGEKRTI